MAVDFVSVDSELSGLHDDVNAEAIDEQQVAIYLHDDAMEMQAEDYPDRHSPAHITESAEALITEKPQPENTNLGAEEQAKGKGLRFWMCMIILMVTTLLRALDLVRVCS